MRLPQWIQRGFSRRSLSGRLMVLLLAIGLSLGALQAIVSGGYATHLVLSSMNEMLDSLGQRDALNLEERLASLLVAGEALASNRLTANALADSAGRQIYLEPLLQSQHFPFRGVSVALLDYRGRPLAGSDAAAARGWDAPDPTAQTARFLEMLMSGGTRAALSPLPGGGQTLELVFPVSYRLSGNVEGALVLRVPLAALTPIADSSEHFALVDAADRVLVGARIPDALESRFRLKLPPPLQALQLTQVLYYDKDFATRRLDALALLYGGFALIYTLIVVLIARLGSRLLGAPLQRLTSVAEHVAASGRPIGYIEPVSDDEFGRLASAFNTMIDRLQASYRALEGQVTERTHALGDREERLRLVMEATGEGVWDWDIGAGIVRHNGAWCALLGLGESYLEHPVSAYMDAIHPEDRSNVLLALSACLSGKLPFNMEYRMCRRNGQVIWVHDRGKVIERNECQDPLRMVGSISDITARVEASTALREQELHLRATIDNLPFLFWLKDTRGRFLTVNRRFAETAGFDSPQAVLGLTDREVWPPELAQRYMEDDDAVLQQRREKAVEEPVQNRDGSRAWMETFKKPVLREDGSLLGTVGFCRDITARRQMEEALRRSEERWQLAISAAHDGIWDWDPSSGRTFYSDRWKAMLGYENNEIRPQVSEWTSRIHPDDHSRVMLALNLHLEGGSAVYQSEYRLRCKDRSYKWVQDRGKARFAEDGTPLRMCGAHTDISERRAAQEQLQERSEQLDAILALSPDGFVAFDDAHRIRYVSPAFLRIFGAEGESLLGFEEAAFGAWLNARCEPATPYPGNAALLAMIGGGGPMADKRLQLELREHPRCAVEVGLYRGTSPAVTAILCFRDVTAEREAERMKSDFLSLAAHELRTPMASIYGFTELLMNMEMDEATRKDVLGTIYDQSGLMVSIVTELLDLAHIEARQGRDFRREPQDLAQLVDNAVASFPLPAGRQPPIVCGELSLCPVTADRQKIQQAIGNVLANAYQYSPQGGEVLIRLQQRGDEDLSEVGVAIEDPGIGMSPAQLARVCERFYRADNSGRIPGTGLGMSIVHEILTLHGGRVELDSEPGQGTRVTLWLPRRETAAPGGDGADAGATASLESISG